MRTLVLLLSLLPAQGALADETPQPTAVPDLIKDLRHPDVQVRAAAARKLEEIGPEARSAVPDLVRLLADNATYPPRFGIIPGRVYNDAFRSLVAIGSEAVAGLTGALDDPDASVRDLAVQALERIGPKAEPALSKLLAAAGDLQPERLVAIRALPKIDLRGDRSIPVLLDRLRDEDPTVREHAAISLTAYPHHAATIVPALLATLKDGEPAVRGQAAESLGLLKSSPRTTVPALTALFADRTGYLDCIVCAGVGGACFGRTVAQDAILAVGEFGADATLAARSIADLFSSDPEESDLTRDALRTTCRMGAAAEPCVPKLVELLEQQNLDSELRWQILETCQALGKTARPASPAIRKLMSREDAAGDEPPVSLGAACALVSIDPDAPPEAWDRVTAALESHSQKFAAARVDFESLGGVPRDLEMILIAVRDRGPTAKSVVPSLVKLGGEFELDSAILRALDRIGPDASPALPVAVQTLEWTSDREATIAALVAIGLQSIPALLSRLEPALESDRDVTGVLEALGRFGGKAAPAVPSVLRVSADPRPAFRAAVASTLARIGTSREETVPALLRLLTDNRCVVRENAALALGTLPTQAAPVVPALILALQDDYIDVRAASASALGQIGPAARSAIPALQQAVRDQNPSVRAAAEQALAKLN